VHPFSECFSCIGDCFRHSQSRFYITDYAFLRTGARRWISDQLSKHSQFPEEVLTQPGTLVTLAGQYRPKGMNGRRAQRAPGSVWCVSPGFRLKGFASWLNWH
jgi:hypothetical protein